MSAASIAELLADFEQAYERVHAMELSTKHVYCLCGREFPAGRVSRITYGSVQYADNRCDACSTKEKS